MFPTTRYFAALPCPYFKVGLCSRYHCHFHHSKSNKQQSGKDDEDDASKANSSSQIIKKTNWTDEKFKKRLEEELVSELLRLGCGSRPLRVDEITRAAGVAVNVACTTTEAIELGHAVNGEDQVKEDETSASPTIKHRSYPVPAGAPTYFATPKSVLERQKSVDTPSGSQEDQSGASKSNFDLFDELLKEDHHKKKQEKKVTKTNGSAVPACVTAAVEDYNKERGITVSSARPNYSGEPSLTQASIPDSQALVIDESAFSQGSQTPVEPVKPVTEVRRPVFGRSQSVQPTPAVAVPRSVPTYSSTPSTPVPGASASDPDFRFLPLNQQIDALVGPSMHPECPPLHASDEQQPEYEENLYEDVKPDIKPRRKYKTLDEMVTFEDMYDPLPPVVDLTSDDDQDIKPFKAPLTDKDDGIFKAPLPIAKKPQPSPKKPEQEMTLTQQMEQMMETDPISEESGEDSHVKPHGTSVASELPDVTDLKGIESLPLTQQLAALHGGDEEVGEPAGAVADPWDGDEDLFADKQPLEEMNVEKQQPPTAKVVASADHKDEETPNVLYNSTQQLIDDAFNDALMPPPSAPTFKKPGAPAPRVAKPSPPPPAPLPENPDDMNLTQQMHDMFEGKHDDPLPPAPLPKIVKVEPEDEFSAFYWEDSSISNETDDESAMESVFGSADEPAKSPPGAQKSAPKQPVAAPSVKDTNERKRKHDSGEKSDAEVSKKHKSSHHHKHSKGDKERKSSESSVDVKEKDKGKEKHHHHKKSKSKDKDKDKKKEKEKKHHHSSDHDKHKHGEKSKHKSSKERAREKEREEELKKFGKIRASKGSRMKRKSSESSADGVFHFDDDSSAEDSDVGTADECIDDFGDAPTGVDPKIVTTQALKEFAAKHANGAPSKPNGGISPRAVEEPSTSAPTPVIAGKSRVAHRVDVGGNLIGNRRMGIGQPRRNPADAQQDMWNRLNGNQQGKRAKADNDDDDDFMGQSTSYTNVKRRTVKEPNTDVLALLGKKQHTSISSGSSSTIIAAARESKAAAVAAAAAAAASSSPKKKPRPSTKPNPPRVSYARTAPTGVSVTFRQNYVAKLFEDLWEIDWENASERALKEEMEIVGQSKTKQIYMNKMANHQRAVRNSAKAPSPPTTSFLQPPRGQQIVVSHLDILAGKGGSKGSWSIEKNRNKIDLDISKLKGKVFYELMKKYVLTKDQLIQNKYPMPDPEDNTRARFPTLEKEQEFKKLHELLTRYKDQPERMPRRCIRCKKEYRVDESGVPTTTGCTYHPNKSFSRRVAGGGSDKLHLCCSMDFNSDGCSEALYHVQELFNPFDARGYRHTEPTPLYAEDKYKVVYAIDCEMVYTTRGSELVRVSLVGDDGELKYNSLVATKNPVLDYNTRYSGIKPGDLDDVTKTLEMIQEDLMNYVSADTILLGHSLESDLKAMKLIHAGCVDTSVVWPHKRGHPFKRALRTVCADVLNRIIQNAGAEGHDSLEDAKACMDLMKHKGAEDVSKLVR